MGTSSKYPGPRGGSWKGANHQLGCWVSSFGQQPTATAISGAPANRTAEIAAEKSGDKARELANLYRAALSSELSANPAAFGLRDALLRAGTRLVGTLESLRAGTAGWFSCDQDSAQTCADVFTQGFAEQIAGSGGLVADAVIRQAAVACARELLNTECPLQEAVRQGVAIPRSSIADDLFCLVFQLFFKESFARFIMTIVAGKIRLAFPLLHAIDPAGRIADCAGQQVAALISDPCAEAEGLANPPSLTDLANELVKESVDRVLGLPVTDPGSPAA